MAPSASAAAAAAAQLRAATTLSRTEMKPLSSSATFVALELFDMEGSLDRCAPHVPEPHLGHVCGAPPRRCRDYKHLKHGNCKNNWTFFAGCGWWRGGVWRGTRSRWREGAGVGGGLVV